MKFWRVVCRHATGQADIQTLSSQYFVHLARTKVNTHSPTQTNTQIHTDTPGSQTFPGEPEQPLFVQPVWQQVVSCKRGLRHASGQTDKDTHIAILRTPTWGKVNTHSPMQTYTQIHSDAPASQTFPGWAWISWLTQCPWVVQNVRMAGRPSWCQRRISFVPSFLHFHYLTPEWRDIIPSTSALQCQCRDIQKEAKISDIQSTGWLGRQFQHKLDHDFLYSVQMLAVPSCNVQWLLWSNRATVTGSCQSVKGRMQRTNDFVKFRIFCRLYSNNYHYYYIRLTAFFPEQPG